MPTNELPLSYERSLTIAFLMRVLTLKHEVENPPNWPFPCAYITT